MDKAHCAACLWLQNQRDVNLLARATPTLDQDHALQKIVRRAHSTRVTRNA